MPTKDLTRGRAASSYITLTEPEIKSILELLRMCLVSFLKIFQLQRCFSALGDGNIHLRTESRCITMRREPSPSVELCIKPAPGVPAFYASSSCGFRPLK